jgi:hypothetical protein
MKRSERSMKETNSDKQKLCNMIQKWNDSRHIGAFSNQIQNLADLILTQMQGDNEMFGIAASRPDSLPPSFAKMFGPRPTQPSLKDCFLLFATEKEAEAYIETELSEYKNCLEVYRLLIKVELIS